MGWNRASISPGVQNICFPNDDSNNNNNNTEKNSLSAARPLAELQVVFRVLPQTRKLGVAYRLSSDWQAWMK